MKRRLSAILILVAALGLPAAAAALFFTSEGGFNWDPTDFAGEMRDGTSDAYDGCYFLESSLGPYRLPRGTMPTTSLMGRQQEMPEVSLGPLMVSRKIYVPATGGDYARYLDIFRNPGTTDVSTTVIIRGNLGSDSGTVQWAESSGDGMLSPADDWFGTDDFDGSGDPSLAHVIQGPGATERATRLTLSFDDIDWAFDVTVPAGGRVAIMTFAIQAADQADARAEAEALVNPDPAALNGLDSYLPDIVNFTVFSPCTTADGTACTSASGLDGLCYGGNCCTGCWDGTRCYGGTTGAHCGVDGGACISCVDTEPCTLDVCTAGVCSNPMAPAGEPCDDGLFCTVSDTCDGTLTCSGVANTCDDGVTCTADTCDDTTDTCLHAPDPTSCVIDGSCIAMGDTDASGCLTCDPSRSSTDWSPVAAGTVCRTASCSAGALRPEFVCDSSGTCTSEPTRLCPSGRCDDFTSCVPLCTSDADCADGEFCNEVGGCEGRRLAGMRCDTGMECASGFCADAVCCDTACDGACVACDLSGFEGVCSPHPIDTDPEMGCGDALCDGMGACGTLVMEDGGTADTGTGPDPDDGGCGCTVPARRDTPLLPWLFALAILIPWWRRVGRR